MSLEGIVGKKEEVIRRMTDDSAQATLIRGACWAQVDCRATVLGAAERISGNGDRRPTNRIGLV